MCYNVAYIEDKSRKTAELFFSDPEILKLAEKVPEPEYYFVSGFVHPQLCTFDITGVQLRQWGLIPAWVKDEQAAHALQNKTLNAVSETVFEKPSYRHAIKQQRCILPLSGFYEWRTYAGKKYPYFIYQQAHLPLWVGCVYEQWLNKATGEVITTFAMLTTPANALMSRIHNDKKRMPLILSWAQAQQWIVPNLSPEGIQTLMVPYAADDLTAHTVAPWVSQARAQRNVPESEAVYNYPELPALDLG